jgi:hypothetical protein
VAGTSSTGPSRGFRIILIVHGVVTLAAAVVLVAFPAAIPATVGIDIGVEVFLLSYFLAAAELAVGILSIGAVRLTDTAAIRLIALVFVVFHLTTAALEITYLVLTGPQPVLAGNVVVRLLAGALFWFLARARHGE